MKTREGIKTYLELINSLSKGDKELYRRYLLLHANNSRGNGVFTFKEVSHIWKVSERQVCRIVQEGDMKFWEHNYGRFSVNIRSLKKVHYIIRKATQQANTLANRTRYTQIKLPVDILSKGKKAFSDYIINLTAEQKNKGNYNKKLGIRRVVFQNQDYEIKNKSQARIANHAGYSRSKVQKTLSRRPRKTVKRNDTRLFIDKKIYASYKEAKTRIEQYHKYSTGNVITSKGRGRMYIKKLQRRYAIYLREANIYKNYYLGDYQEVKLLQDSCLDGSETVQRSSTSYNRIQTAVATFINYNLLRFDLKV